MNAPSEISAAARALDQRDSVASRLASAAAASSLVLDDPAGHSRRLLAAATPALAIPVPRQLYRMLAWPYWLLALSLAIACWWTILALL